jgi:hypothetical protein
LFYLFFLLYLPNSLPLSSFLSFLSPLLLPLPRGRKKEGRGGKREGEKEEKEGRREREREGKEGEREKGMKLKEVDSRRSFTWVPEERQA